MNNRSGFTMVEILVVTALLSVTLTAGFLLFMTGQTAWTSAEARIGIQQNLRKILLKLSAELEESGTDAGGNLKVSINDGGGIAGSDILTFSVPVCLCGTRVMDASGNVKAWGAAMQWGQAGCSNTFPVETNGKVIICHLPPGNPSNEHTLQVAPSAVEAHLSHGDRLGDCSACSVGTYNNHFVRYSINSDQRMLRTILDENLIAVKQDVIADKVTDFQAVLSGGQDMVSVTLEMQNTVGMSRNVTVQRTVNVVLRNRS